MMSTSIRTSPSTGLRLVLRALLILWASFWAWFVLAVSYGGKELPPPWWIPAIGLAALAGLFVLAWRRPRAGGSVLIAAGLVAAATFRDPWSIALLAAPAVLLGAGCLVQRNPRKNGLAPY